jgi:hypothetical protein
MAAEMAADLPPRCRLRSVPAACTSRIVEQRLSDLAASFDVLDELLIEEVPVDRHTA